MLAMVLNFHRTLYISLHGRNVVALIKQPRLHFFTSQLVVFRCAPKEFEENPLTEFKMPKIVHETLFDDLIESFGTSVVSGSVYIVDIFQDDKKSMIYDQLGNLGANTVENLMAKPVYNVRTYLAPLKIVKHIRGPKFKKFRWVPSIFPHLLSDTDFFRCSVVNIGSKRHYASFYLQRQRILAEKMSNEGLDFLNPELFSWFLLGGSWNNQKVVKTSIFYGLKETGGGMEISAILTDDKRAIFRGESRLIYKKSIFINHKSYNYHYF